MTSITTHLQHAEENLEKADFILKQTLTSQEEFQNWSQGRFFRSDAIFMAQVRTQIAVGHLEAAKVRNL